MIGFWIVAVAYMVCITIMVVSYILKDQVRDQNKIDSLERRVKKLEEDKDTWFVKENK